MVVSAREEASKIGASILKKGGNAFDAMAATQFALAVAHPSAGNIGGGGFMVYRKNDGDIGSLDFREKAPLSANKNMYLDSIGNVIPDMSTLGATAVGIPGSVAGAIAVHEKFGKLPLASILEPVIALAERGVVVTEKQATKLARYTSQFLEVNGDSSKFSITYKKGDTIKYKALANTLRTISAKGHAGFYEGEVAEKLTNFIQNNGGFITKERIYLNTK